MSAGLQLPAWTLGDHIRKARRLAGLTQARLAALYGVSDKAVDNWEKDRNYPSDIQSLLRILQDNGVDPKFFPRDLLPHLDSNQKPTVFSQRVVAKRSHVNPPIGPIGLVPAA